MRQFAGAYRPLLVTAFEISPMVSDQDFCRGKPFRMTCFLEVL
jgi:hypothetical protein